MYSNRIFLPEVSDVRAVQNISENSTQYSEYTYPSGGGVVRRGELRGGGVGRRNVTPAENSVSKGSHCPDGMVL